MAESTGPATVTALISPPDDLVIPALRFLRVENPSLGASKLLALLLASNPSWTVSEKRLRKLLQREGLGLSSSTGATTTAAGSIPESSAAKKRDSDDDIGLPISKINPRLKVDKWTEKVRVEDFGLEKGKGLVATARIEEGDLIWKEDPLVTCPDWYAYIHVSRIYCSISIY